MKGASTQRSVVDRALQVSPFQWAFMRRANDRLAVLAYHGIDDLDRFRQHLDFLEERFRLVSLEELLSAIRGGEALPPRSVLLTFDDGERSVLESAAPELLARGIPSAVFVVVGLIGTDLPFWWVEAEALAVRARHRQGDAETSFDLLLRKLKRVPDEERIGTLDRLREGAPDLKVRSAQLTAAELTELEASGMAVASHSLTHPCLSRCEPRKVKMEVEESSRILIEMLGHSPRAFAYPDGDCSDEVRRMIADAGYEAAFLFDHRLSARAVAEPLRISRVRINSTTTLDRFATIVSGLHPAIHHARGRN
jgi:peptidoglycan/xylan/chitin deacetylase (PgdA/CDA1 family)